MQYVPLCLMLGSLFTAMFIPVLHNKFQQRDEEPKDEMTKGKSDGSELKIKVEYCGNPDFIEIHTNHFFTHEYLFLGKPSEEWLPFMHQIWNKVAGITEMNCRAYSFSVQKGEMFTRKKVAEAVVKEFIKIFGEGKVVVREPDYYYSEHHREEDY